MLGAEDLRGGRSERAVDEHLKHGKTRLSRGCASAAFIVTRFPVVRVTVSGLGSLTRLSLESPLSLRTVGAVDFFLARAMAAAVAASVSTV